MQYHLRIGKGFMPEIRRASVRDIRSPVLEVARRGLADRMRPGITDRLGVELPLARGQAVTEENLRSKHPAIAVGMKVCGHLRRRW